MAKTKRRNVKKGTSTKKKSDCGCKYKYNYGGTKKDLKPELRADIPDILSMQEYPQHRFESGIILPEDQALMNNVSDNEWLNKIAEHNLETIGRELDSDDEIFIEGLLNLSESHDNENDLNEAIESANAFWAAESAKPSKPTKKRKSTKSKSSSKPKRVFKPSEETLKNWQMPPDNSSKKAGGYLIDEDSDDADRFPSTELKSFEPLNIDYESTEPTDSNDSKMQTVLLVGSTVILVTGGIFIAGATGGLVALSVGDMIR